MSNTLKLEVSPHLEGFNDPRLKIKAIVGNIGGLVIGMTIQRDRINKLRNSGVEIWISTICGKQWSHPV